MFYLLPNLPVDNEINEADAADISLPELANLCKFAFKALLLLNANLHKLVFISYKNGKVHQQKVKTSKKKKN